MDETVIRNLTWSLSRPASRAVGLIATAERLRAVIAVH